MKHNPTWTDRLFALSLLAILALAVVMYARGPHGQDSEGHAGFEGRVAWIDYDNGSARTVFRNFVAVFDDAQIKSRTHHDVEFFGADVMNETDLENAVRRVIQRKPAVIVATSVLVAQAVR